MTVLIVDLSNNQARVDVKEIAAARYCTGIYHKATEGTGFADGRFWPRRNAAAKYGLRFGAYHFARPDQPHGGAAEAERFCRMVGKLDRRDLRPVLDYERHAWFTTAEHFLWIVAFNRTVREKLGVWPLFYSYPAFIQELKLPRPVGAGLWLAAIGSNDGTEHAYRVPAPWKKAVLHQYTWRAHIRGVEGECDMNAAPRIGPLLANPWTGRL